MSMRFEMLQVACLAPKALCESALLVRDFPVRQLTDEGHGCDPAGKADSYDTIFVLAGLVAMQAEIPVARVKPCLRTFGDGVGLDFVHLGALASGRAFARPRQSPTTVRILTVSGAADAKANFLQPLQVGVPVNDGDRNETVIFRDIIPIGGAESRFSRLRVSTP